MSGDNAYLDALLLPDYRSVNADGTAHGKSTVARKPKTTEERAKIEAWLKANPIEAKVVIDGNTAVLTWFDPARGPEQGVRSADIFVYLDGHWHAIYSQHASERAD